LRLVMPAMLGLHSLIGVGEALITVAAVGFVARARPELVGAAEVNARGGRLWVVGGLLVALLVVLVSPWASADPDGLERVARELGFLGRDAGAPYRLMPDYIVPGLGETSTSTIAAGVLGMLAVVAVVTAAAWWLRRAAPSG
jgi:cobalt/nickel transport system permease protein